MDLQQSWCENDGEFSYGKFYNNILALFEDEEWAADVLEWYNV